MQTAVARGQRAARIAIVTVALMLSAATTGFAQSIPIRVGAGPDDPSIPLLYAATSGIYAKAGLNVEIVQLGGAAAVAAALAGGSLEIGKGAPLTVVQAMAKGLPFTIVGNIAQYIAPGVQTGLVVLKDSPIKSARDFNGQVMAGISLQDQNVVSTLNWIDQNGGDSSTLHYIEIPASATVAAMEQGRVVGAALYEPWLTAALETGKVRLVADTYGAVAKRWSDAILFANKSWVDAHQDLLRRFLVATAQASAYVAGHESEMGPVHAQFGASLDPALLAIMHHPIRGVAIEPSDLQPVLDLALKYKLIAEPMKAPDMICSCALRRTSK